MRRLALLAGLAALSWPSAAMAQRAAENALNSADDAFGSSVGLENTGIYSESDTRGFSPTKAGNARIDGIYYDPVGSLSSRLRVGNVVRVGFAAEEYPFQAPTGIVEYRLRPFPDKFGVSLAWNQMAFGGYIPEADIRLPVVAGHIGLQLGAAMSDLRNSDGARNKGYGVTARAIFRYGGIEVAPFVTRSGFRHNLGHALAVVSGQSSLPDMPQPRVYLGQDWARGRSKNNQAGVVIKAALTKRLSLRAGLFHAQGDRLENYSEVYKFDTLQHILIADPRQALHSTSGEAQLAWRFATGRLQSRLIAGYRARSRYTQTGGSDYIFSTAPFQYGTPDPLQQRSFNFSPVNVGTVRQSAFMLGYIGKLQGLGTINLGVQKARYRAETRDGLAGNLTSQRDDPWLYNATLGIELTPKLSVFVGTEKGLEDSGIAPENAANRNAQLPATRATQYEAGLRWKLPVGQISANVFQIRKPYFSYDAANQYVRAGEVRHRGVEFSLSTQSGRLHLLAGAILMQPRVSGPLVDQGLVGEHPAGTPSTFVRVDANYRTDIFGGLTPTASLVYTGARAVGSRPLAALGGKQLMVSGFATLDLGLRQQFHIGKVPTSFRFLVYNVFDSASWKVVAPDTMFMDERRRWNLTVAADF